MNDGWDRLLRAARAVLNAREVSPFVYAGQVGAAWRTESGNIYVGACVDGVCGPERLRRARRPLRHAHRRRTPRAPRGGGEGKGRGAALRRLPRGADCNL